MAIGYAAGNLIGPQTFWSDQAPQYTGGVVNMLAAYAVCMLILGAYWAFATWENRRRDRKYGKPQHEQEQAFQYEGTVLDGFVDETDMKQPRFRYTT